MTTPYQGLRILLVAPVDEAGHAHNALRRRALGRLGAVVTHFDPGEAGWLDRLVRRDVGQRLQAAVAEAAPDLVLVSGEGVLTPDTVARVRAARRADWGLLLGDAVGDVEAAGVEAMAYDHLFVGATGLIEVFRRFGLQRVHYLPQGCDPSVHRPLRARGPFRANVVFAGTATAYRERMLAGAVEFGLALWGRGWRTSALRDYCRGELSTTEDYVRACAGASVAVNIHRGGAEEAGRDASGVNRRTFELAAIGVPQVVDDRPDLARHFEDGTDVLVYGTPEQFRGQVKRAMQEEKYRERLAASARQRAMREHTHMHRMTLVLQTLTGKR